MFPKLQDISLQIPYFVTFFNYEVFLNFFQALQTNNQTIILTLDITKLTLTFPITVVVDILNYVTKKLGNPSYYYSEFGMQDELHDNLVAGVERMQGR